MFTLRQQRVITGVEKFLGDPSLPLQKVVGLRGKARWLSKACRANDALIALCEGGVTEEAIHAQGSDLEGAAISLQIARRAPGKEGVYLLLKYAMGSDCDDILSRDAAFDVVMGRFETKLRYWGFWHAMLGQIEAARLGNLPALEGAIAYVGSSSAHWAPTSDLLLKAAKGGHVHVVKYVLGRSVKHDAFRLSRADISKALNLAAKRGDVEMVKLLVRDPATGRSCCTPETLRLASRNNRLDVVKYLRSPAAAGPDGERCPWDEDVLFDAAGRGYLDVVRFLRSKAAAGPDGKRCPWDARVLGAAANNGHVNVVRFLRSKEAAGSDGKRCPWAQNALYVAAKNGHIEVVRFLRSGEAAGPDGERCPWGASALCVAARCDHLDVVRFLRSEEAAGPDGKRCPWDANALRSAARNGHSDVVRFLRSAEAAGPDGARCPWSECVLRAAAERGHSDIVRFLLSDEAVGSDGARCPVSDAVQVMLEILRLREAARRA